MTCNMLLAELQTKLDKSAILTDALFPGVS